MRRPDALIETKGGTEKFESSGLHGEFAGRGSIATTKHAVIAPEEFVGVKGGWTVVVVKTEIREISLSEKYLALRFAFDGRLWCHDHQTKSRHALKRNG